MRIPTMEGLTFEEAPHIYRLDGVEIPSVTEIMKPLSAVKYGGVNSKVLNAAAERGTIIHNAAQTWALYGIMDYPPELSGYFDGFASWFNQTDPKVEATEYRVFHPLLRYAGTVDLLAEIDGNLILVDYKTTQTISDMLCRVQLEAYTQALSSQGIPVEGKKIIQIKKDGTYRVRDYTVKDAEAWRVFGALKTIHDYIRKGGD